MKSLEDRRQRFRNILGLTILIAAFAWSLVFVAIRTFGPGGETALTKDKKVIRFSHWQLEGGVVRAYDWACREYMRLHPDVVVEQIDVHERAYSQWVQTQLIGRMAPDLVELRFTGNLVVRYFVPMTYIIEKPNPYNSREWDARLLEVVLASRVQRVEADDSLSDAEKHAQVETLRRDAAASPVGELDGVAWRDTYIDGMLGSYNVELQDYYSIPTSVFTQRCFANATILKEAAGVTEPPKTLGEFFKICRDIEDYARRNNLRLVPIAGSRYTEEMFRNRYWDMGTWNLMEKQDIDGDGAVSNGERILAIFSGRIDLQTDHCVETAHKALYDICRYFNPGFMAANRDQSVFLFAQGNAAMIATGTWDAGSLWQQVEGDFPIMVFDYPVPAPGEPYSDVMRYRMTEAATAAQGLFGLSKFSRNPETAIDFMQFLTSLRINEELNRRFRWFPAIRGAKTDRLLEAFAPKNEGIYNAFYIGRYLGPDTELRYLQQYTDFISTMPKAGVPYEEFIDEHYRRFIKQAAHDFRQFALGDFVTAWQNSYSAAVQSEVALTQVRGRAMREGLTPEIQRNYAAIILGQMRRLQGRAVEWSQYEQAKAAYEAEEAQKEAAR